MSTLGSVLGALAGPLAKKVATALGFGVVAFVGVDLALNAIITTARESWGGLGADIAVYMAMAGVNTAFSIIAGAMSSRLGLIALKRMSLL